MSSFTYNEITIPYAAHTSFSQEAVYDPSNTDRMYTRFDITVQGILNSSLAGVIGAEEGSNDNAASIMKNIRGKLLTPRRPLAIDFDGLELLPTADGVDAKNGPLPQVCNIQRLTTATFLISFRIVTHRCESEFGETGGNAVVSVRWRQTQSIDNCNFSTRTRTGSFTIRSDNLQGVQADQLRSSMAILAIPSGFVRESSEYTISEDGLTLSFTIRDKEVWLYPPEPAFQAQGSYQETSTHRGSRRSARCSVTLQGSKTSPNATLMRTAVAICANKLFNDAGVEPRNNVNAIRLTNCTISQDLWENRCSCTMEAILNPWPFGDANSRLYGVDGINFAKLARPPLGSSPEQQTGPRYQDYGSAGGKRGVTPYSAGMSMLVEAAQYFDPSAAGVKLDRPTGLLNNGTPIGEG